MEWNDAKDVKKDIREILKVIDMPHVKISSIHCYRTEGSKVRAYARTWAFPKIFQRALGVEPAYVIEVLSKHYDKLPIDDKKRVLIHELLHIPKNFSGALLSHKGNNRNIHTMTNKLYKEYKEREKRKA